MTSVKEEPTSKQVRDVDLTAAGRGVWLVKVPKYLSEKWKKASGKCEVGRLMITRSKVPNTMPEVTFSMNDAQMKQEVPGQPNATPKDHKFRLTGVGNQNLVVFSEDRATPPGPSAEEITEKIAIEGKVIQRAECRPAAIADMSYLKLKKQQMVSSNKPQREIKQISTIVPKYKPISNHPSEIAHQKKMKEEGKRIRQDKDQVMDKLFEIFEKHQYYNIQDLVRLTSQPITYLKEILKEICIYNVKAPHKNMWELRPEYRHYKDPK
ncbi:general transcription factor IIF subunit 2-like [Mercenaria mercenaria]|uniref:general transcription factor IIF subunit 2-like n=1 Tax=Mercenaria mercenaria TaxID=6596 RepID=UPI00234E41F5|nr:general transcription factor IIF subunit 2-like [Mercenaria mercenaria]